MTLFPVRCALAALVVASVALAQLWLALPIIVGACGFIGIAVAMIAWMPETGFKSVPRPCST